MSRPVIILALPRCGTRMVSRAASRHPSISEITHEFRGTESEYWKHPYVLSNFLKPWMTQPRWRRVLRYPFLPLRWRAIRLIHLYREDYVQGARSILMMGYTFPPGVQSIPIDRVLSTAKERKQVDETFRDVAEFSVSYEFLTNGGSEITQLPSEFVDRFCMVVGVAPQPIEVTCKKSYKVVLKNEDELRCLVV